jgi:RNA polymerase sigma factor (sigma-70 family)
VSASHAADLELARQCAAGDEKAWDRFVGEYRPILHRAAQTLDPSGRARELADALYADLYGIREGERQSLFRYFQGRSSLATWLRAVLAQRYVDRLRAERRLEPLPDEARELPSAADIERYRGGEIADDPDRPRHAAMVRQAIGLAVARLADRDRLRLAFYYVQELTLAETGRLLQEHEATVSRRLARTRRDIRAEVERQLRLVRGLNEAQIAECFASAADDPGTLDLDRILREADELRESPPDRALLMRRP